MFKKINKSGLIKNIYVLYSAVFVLMFVIIFSPFILGGKSFLYLGGQGCADGFTQHSLFMRDYVSAIKNFFKTGSFDFWNWNLGLGADNIISYSYYSMFDPLTVVAYIFPLSMIEYSYAIIIALRMFLAGIFFIIYIKHMGIKSDAAKLAATVAYVFSYMVVFSAIRHPMFTNGPLILPLAALGVEKLLKGKRPYLLIFSAFYSLISQFYMFAYMSVFFEAYLLLRYFSVHGKESRKKHFPRLLIINLWYLAGALIGGFVLLPNLLGLMGGSRAGSKGFLMYNLLLYAGLIPSMYFPLSLSNYTQFLGNFAVLYTVFMFFSRRDNEKWLKIMLISILAMMSFSVFGYVFSIFTYANNRWAYIYILPVGLIVAKVLDNYNDYNNPQTFRRAQNLFTGLILPAVLVGAYYVFAAASGILKTLGAAAVVLITAGIFAFRIYKKRRIFKIKPAKKLLFRPSRTFLCKCIIVFTAVILCIYQIFAPFQYFDRGDFNRLYSAEPDYMMAEIDTGFYRSAKASFAGNRVSFNNDSLYGGYKSIYLFNTMSSSSVTDMVDFFNVNNPANSVGYNGFDNRAVLDAVASVKYYSLREGELDFLPYGYSYHTETEVPKYAGSPDNFKPNDFLYRDGQLVYEKAYIYQNDLFLPFGFVYNNAVSVSGAEKLHPLERSNLLLSNAIVPDNIAASLIPAATTGRIEKLQAGTPLLKDVETGGGVVNVLKDGGTLTYTLPGFSNCELYAEIQNIVYENNLKESEITFSAKTSKTEFAYALGTNYSYHNPDFLVNLGYYGEAVSGVQATITFKHAGKYTFGDISFYVNDMRGYAGNISDLTSRALGNIEIASDNIKGDITLTEKGVLFLSIPYTESWKAYVNGKPVQTFAANIGYTGILLDGGYSQIELRYSSAYWKEGVLLSAAALGFVVVFSVVAEIRIYRRKKDE